MCLFKTDLRLQVIIFDIARRISTRELHMTYTFQNNNRKFLLIGKPLHCHCSLSDSWNSSKSINLAPNSKRRKRVRTLLTTIPFNFTSIKKRAHKNLPLKFTCIRLNISLNNDPTKWMASCEKRSILTHTRVFKLLNNTIDIPWNCKWVWHVQCKAWKSDKNRWLRWKSILNGFSKRRVTISRYISSLDKNNPNMRFRSIARREDNIRAWEDECWK